MPQELANLKTYSKFELYIFTYAKKACFARVCTACVRSPAYQGSSIDPHGPDLESLPELSLRCHAIT